MINKSDRFIHKKTGDVYLIVSKTKIKISDKWVEGVIYTRDDLEYGDLYTREIKNFMDKFEKIFHDNREYLSS